MRADCMLPETLVIYLGRASKGFAMIGASCTPAQNEPPVGAVELIRKSSTYACARTGMLAGYRHGRTDDLPDRDRAFEAANFFGF